jgi:internalin A
LPEHLLAYLDNAGTVFYRSGLFNDQIILDQSWALEAIYPVFRRDRCGTCGGSQFGQRENTQK